MDLEIAVIPASDVENETDDDDILLGQCTYAAPTPQSQPPSSPPPAPPELEVPKNAEKKKRTGSAKNRRRAMSISGDRNQILNAGNKKRRGSMSTAARNAAAAKTTAPISSLLSANGSRLAMRRGSAANITRADFSDLASSIKDFHRNPDIQEKNQKSLDALKAPSSSFSSRRGSTDAAAEVLSIMEENQVVEYEDDWNMVTSPATGGVIWIHKRTGQIRNYPPNYVIKKQQDQILFTELEKSQLHRELEEAKARIKTLEALSSGTNTQRLTEQLGEATLQLEESELKRAKFEELYAKTQAELHEKKNFMARAEKEVKLLEVKATTYELKACETDRLTAKVEQLNEKISGHDSILREKEHEVLQSRRTVDQTNKNLEAANETIAELKVKNEDLKYQVRAEIERNSRIERGLQEIEESKEICAQAIKEREKLEQVIEDKEHLLSAARRSLREYRDKLKTATDGLEDAQRAQEELKLVQFENNTLKKLHIGKDSLLVRKGHALDSAKRFLGRLQLHHPDLQEDLNVLLDELNSLPAPNGTGASAPNIRLLNRSSQSRANSPISVTPQIAPIGYSQVNLTNLPENGANSYRRFSKDSFSMPSPPSASPAPHHLSASQTFLRGADQPVVGPKTAVVKPVVRSTVHMLQPSSAMQMLLGDAGETQRATDSKPKSRRPRSSDLGLSKNEQDSVASLFIHLGDRVTLAERCDSSVTHAGVVKYVGSLDRPQDRKIFVGLKMEEKVGNCDGTHAKTRYFEAPAGHGKIVRASAIHSVYNMKTKTYKLLEDNMKDYLSHQKTNPHKRV